MNFEPKLLSFADGREVDAENWSERRKEILSLFSEHVYGVMPQRPACVKGTMISKADKCACGNAELERIQIAFDTPKGEFSFPIWFAYPKNGKKNPAFVFINFSGEPYEKYLPLEEIIDGGFCVAIFNYEDVTSDDGDFTDGLAGCFPRSGKKNEWGKIGMWAYAASAVGDHIMTREAVDVDKLAVIGHSRLGKTALWCVANDEKFSYAVSNDSGCCGAAYERCKHEGAETALQIAKKFPFWFCEEYVDTALNGGLPPVDQHMLLGVICPRSVLVGSADEDLWADPYSEQLSCLAASEAWSLFGKKGFGDFEKEVPTGFCFDDGAIHYHKRKGLHFLGRADWQKYMKYIKNKE